MSYILDALKKAETERKLGAVPDLHAQLYADAPASVRTSAWSKPWPWLALVATAAAIAAIALLRPWAATAPSPQPTAALTTPAAPVPPTPTPAPAPAMAATTPAPAPAKPAPQAARPAPEKKPVVPATPPTEPKRPTSATQPEPAPAPQPNEAIPTLRELPDHIQQQIPKFSTNGFLYSPNKADRTVLINQKLLREGDQVAPDLTLETLTPSGMVLNYRGHRFRTSY